MAEQGQRIMQPLQITAHLRGPISLPGGHLALDSLLAAAVARRDGLPPVIDEPLPIEIPVAREPGGRFHLASVAYYQWERMELHWLNKRSPVAEAQWMGEPRLKRILLAGGLSKNWRIPMEKGHVRGDALAWWCMGEPEEIRALLSLTSHLGKKRAAGLGRVLRWEVAPIEPWEGFPCVREGKPTRPLPPDFAGLREPLERAYGRLTYPYWYGPHLEVVVPGVGSG